MNKKLNKRQKLVVVTILLTIIFLLIQLVPVNFRYLTIILFAFISYGASIFALKEDLKAIEWLTLPILPVFFSVGAALFYFLLPVRWLTRLPFTIIYGISIYAILLSDNIFNVAAIRTIQLYKAALAVFSFITILTFFLYTNIVLSFQLACYINMAIFLFLSLIGFILNFWVVTLDSYLDKRIVKIALFLAVIIGEITFIVSFWPVTPLVSSLFLTTVFYLTMMITQSYLFKKPSGSLIWEYLLFIFTLLILIGRARWGG